MNPNIWGPHAWNFLHTITINYPYNPTEDEKRNIVNFFNGLSNQLPCEKCKIHYKQLLKENPIEYHNNDKNSIFKWLVNIHNQVNKSLGKKTWSINEIFNKYMKIYSSHPISNQQVIFLPKKRCKWSKYLKIIILLFCFFLIIRILNSINIKWNVTKKLS